MAFLAAPVAMKVGKSALNYACTEGVEQIGGFIKNTIHTHMDKVCEPTFPAFLADTVFGMMKSSRFFPRQIREILEARREILESFVTEKITSDPRFAEACSTKNFDKIDAIVDEKMIQLKDKIAVCPTKEGGKSKKKTRRVKRKRTFSRSLKNKKYVR